MAHIELVCYGSPIKHKKFIEEVNNWEYPLEGNVRKGVARPFVSEVKLYDVRIKEELAPQFLRDINISPFMGMQNGVNEKGFRPKMINFLLYLLRKAMGHTEIEKAEGKQKFSLPDWFYVFNVINFKDPKQKDPITGEMKEVL